MENANNAAEAAKPEIKSKSKWWRRWLLRIAGSLILLYGIYVLVGYFFTYSSGFRAGKIIKFSNKGYVFKTWEGQLFMGAIAPDDGGIATKFWNFSVDRGNTVVRKSLEDAMVKKQDVRLHYKEKLVQFSWRGETTYFVDSVDLVK